MKKSLLSCVLVLLLAVCCVSEYATVSLEKHFKVLSKVRHPRYEDGVPWLNARKYIKDRMLHYGVRNFEEQVFNTTLGGETVEGVNLIGIAQGMNDTGGIIVVGADYSTKLVGNPLKDNTGGIACFLETMHLFFDSVYWHPFYQNHTVIFVAFDLNTREFEGDGMGRPGSNIFVHEWLVPYLEYLPKGNQVKAREFLGAVILDSVTTYNTGNNTQYLRQGSEEAMPNATEEITEKGKKGDFLGFLFSSSQKDNAIKKTFFKRYNMDRKKTPFRLQEMEVHLDLGIVGDEVLEMFNHQAHYPFWTNLEGEPLPAFLLFDTDDDRTDPTPNACSLTEGCDLDEFLTEQRIDFMAKTTNVLVTTLLELQATPYEVKSSGSVYDIPPIFMLTLTSLIALLFK